VPVIMCTFRRLGRLPATLAMLGAQSTPVQVLIWDNSRSPGAVAKAAADAHIPAAVHHSPRNVGGFGRFYLARAAAEQGHQAVIFIDDDQDFGPEAIGDLIGRHRARSLSGWFAFRNLRTGDRVPCAPGSAADYVGTGGMICDTAVFSDPRLYRLPRRFWFIEDIWLCAVARHLAGYAVYASPARFALAPDGRDQCRSLGWAKKRLRRWLGRRGLGR